MVVLPDALARARQKPAASCGMKPMPRSCYMPDKLLKRDLSEHLFAQDLPKQRVNRPGARHVHERAPRIDAVVDPRRSPVARRPDETLGEVALLCARISCLDFQATVKADVYI